MYKEEPYSMLNSYNNKTNEKVLFDNLNLNKLETGCNTNNDFEEKFDTTGMFHWSEERSIQDAMLDITQKHEFSNHVILCIFADKSSPLIGLRNFVMPLRASNYFYEELKPIIFIGNKDFLSKEWKTICNFPKIYVVEV